MRQSKEIKTAILLLILHTSVAKPGKNTAPAVFEVINEQSRIDDKRTLPYGNPLAGNSQQNAKIHAQHQQAMFNAERVRQHRAQLMRWNQQPTRQQTDSYMKAYQESQENHHLALEQMQSNVKERKSRRPERPQSDRKTLKDRPQLEPVKLTRGDAVDKNRNHRSYGSVYGVQKKRKIVTYPGPTYDQGVTIKPNGNEGLHSFEKEQRGLYTEAIPSKTQYVYPKLYSQMHAYQSANDITALNTLLTKPAQEQLTQLSTLIHHPKETGKDNLEAPIDLFFYVKEPQVTNLEQIQTAYAAPYAPEFNSPKDHTPITEDVDDVQDENASRVPIQAYTPTVPTVFAQIPEEPTTTKSNYYKIEVEQTVSGNIPKDIQYSAPEKPNYETLTYEKPLNIYLHGPSTEGVKYLQSQPTGVQHLSQDGTGVSAYGDDDVSIKRNRTKRQLDTELFILGNETIAIENPVTKDPVLNETLINFEINCTVTIKNVNDTAINGTETDRSAESLPEPEEYKRFSNNKYIAFDNAHQIGEAYEYDDVYDYDSDEQTGNSKFDYSDESDYDLDDDFSSPEDDYDEPETTPKPKRRPNKNRERKRRPNSNKNRDSKFRHPDYFDYHPQPDRDYLPPSASYYPPSQQYGIPVDSYGPPPLQSPPSYQFGPPSNSYGEPIQQYGPPMKPRPSSGPYPSARPQISNTISAALPSVSSVIDTLEPVYLLTSSQIKEISGQQSLNIEHLDIFQMPKDTKPSRRPPRRPRAPRRPKKNFPRRYPKKGRRNRGNKLRKINKIVMF